MDNHWLDSQVDRMLKGTFEMIPIIFAEDAVMKARMDAQIPQMKAFTKKMWCALEAKSTVEYLMLTARLGDAFVTCNPQEVLKCRHMADLFQAIEVWAQEVLGIKFSAEELSGKASLEALGQAVGKAANEKLAKLRQSS